VKRLGWVLLALLLIAALASGEDRFDGKTGNQALKMGLTKWMRFTRARFREPSTAAINSALEFYVTAGATRNQKLMKSRPDGGKLLASVQDGLVLVGHDLVDAESSANLGGKMYTTVEAERSAEAIDLVWLILKGRVPNPWEVGDLEGARDEWENRVRTLAKENEIQPRVDQKIAETQKDISMLFNVLADLEEPERRQVELKVFIWLVAQPIVD